MTSWDNLIQLTNMVIIEKLQKANKHINNSKYTPAGNERERFSKAPLLQLYKSKIILNWSVNTPIF